MVIACAGYRVTAKNGHDKITFDALRLAVGAAAGSYVDYFDDCRRKRNIIDYTCSHVATETEAKEIVETATELSAFVEARIEATFKSLKR